MFRIVASKPVREVIAEWDALASVRRRQIATGLDISYNQVITPTIIHLAENIAPRRVLDAGCGVGILSSKLATLCDELTAIDPSPQSIVIARADDSRVHFVNKSIEDFADTSSGVFDLVVANMVLMDVISLRNFLQACRKVVSQGKHFVFSITHPCFWPDYYGYSTQPWYAYEREIIIEAPFRISTDDKETSLISTHVHRPLSMYAEELGRSRFRIEGIIEPAPGKDVDKGYVEKGH